MNSNCFFLVAECKKRWTSLRDAYRKSIKCQTSRSGDAAKKIKHWRFEEQMAFMRPFTFTRQQITNVEVIESEDHESDDEQDLSSSSSQAQTKNSSKFKTLKSRKPISTATVLENYLKEKRSRQIAKTSGDHLSKFFSSIEETVRTFSTSLQIDVKSKIFNIVLEAEKLNMNNELIDSDARNPYPLQPSNYQPSLNPSFLHPQHYFLQTSQYPPTHQEQQPQYLSPQMHTNQLSEQPPPI